MRKIVLSTLLLVFASVLRAWAGPHFVGTPSCTVSKLGIIKSTGTVALTVSGIYPVTLKGSANSTCTSYDVWGKKQTKTFSLPLRDYGAFIQAGPFHSKGNYGFNATATIVCPGQTLPTFIETPFEATVTLGPSEFDTVTVTCQ
jgi:hypothetical protein